MSDAAKIFWGSIVRHILTIICGAIVAHGYVTQTGAQLYIEELVGLTLSGCVMLWANRVHYWEIIKRIVAHQLPAGSTEAQVADRIASMQAVGVPMPSVKALSYLLVLALLAGAAGSAACSTNQYHSFVVADTALVSALHLTVQSEQAAYNAKAFDATQHKANAAALLKVLQGANAINAALMAWKPGQPKPAEVAAAIAALDPILVEAARLAPKSKFLIDIREVLALFTPLG